MKYIWQISFVLSFCWASIVTYKYLQVKNNPLVMNVSMEGIVSDSQSLLKVERITFVRQFVEKYVSFEPDTFWQAQTALSFLLSSDLRDQRLAEINRLKNKIQKNQVTQRGQILSIQEQQEKYFIEVEIFLFEGKQVTKLRTHMTLQLKESARNLDNPWGLIISALQFSKLDQEQNSDFVGGISMATNKLSILHFPCAVENFEVPPELPLKVKITTLNVSEIQLYLTKEQSEPARLKALCKDREFTILVTPALGKTDLFVKVPLAASKVRGGHGPSDKTSKKSSLYKKTIESELGFVIEE